LFHAKRFKDELHNVISGKKQVRRGAIIQTITSYLDNGTQTSRNNPEEKRLKNKKQRNLKT
jgi:hypothetical protein